MAVYVASLQLLPLACLYVLRNVGKRPTAATLCYALSDDVLCVEIRGTCTSVLCCSLFTLYLGARWFTCS
jgi:hypothetical protein